MSTMTVLLDTEGPQTRCEFDHCCKAFALLTGKWPKEIHVSFKTIRAWEEWPSEEQLAVAYKMAINKLDDGCYFDDCQLSNLALGTIGGIGIKRTTACEPFKFV